MAVGPGHWKMIHILIKMGLNIEAQDKRGATPLFHAVAQGNTFTIDRLISQYDADVDAIAHDGTTPLLFASILGKLEAAKTLLACGANPEVKTLSGHGMEECAYFSGHHKVAQELAKLRK